MKIVLRQSVFVSEDRIISCTCMVYRASKNFSEINLAKSNVVVALLHMSMCTQIPQLNPNLALFDQFTG